MRVLADGPGKAYLKTACAHGSPYALCAFKDLPLDNSQDMLWSDDRQQGHLQRHHLSTPGCDRAGGEPLRAPRGRRPPVRAVRRLAANWGQQLGMSYLDDPLKNPHYYLTNAYWSTTNLPLADQHAARLRARSLGLWATLSVDGSDLAVRGLAVPRPWRDRRLAPVPARYPRRDRAARVPRLGRRPRAAGDVSLTLLVGAVLVNAFVCGALSGPFPRYQARISWLVSAAATWP